MWFLGGLLGLIVGAMADGGEGALLGAALGMAIGIAIAQHKTSVAGAAILERIAKLERLVDELGREFRRTGAPLGESERLSDGQERATPAAADRSTELAAAKPIPGVEAALPASPLAQPVPAAPLQEAPPPRQEPAARPAVPSEPTPAVRPLPPERPFWWKWIFGGNTLVRAGIAILFVGIAFLAKYAAEHVQFPVELRLAAIAAGGVAMLVIGWRLRLRRPGYALSMQGGGVGVLYLTVFAALRLYSMLPPVLAFGLLVGIVVASSLLAVAQDSMALAAFASAGGFLAPVLTSTGHGSHVALFSYYLLLNLGIFAIAWIKAWRPLNILGFIFTFVISGLWGWKSYQPEFFASTEPFLVIFFLLYVGIALLYALRRSLEVKHYVDGTLVFGTPIVAFGLQSPLVKDFEYGLAFSALALAAFYIVLAGALWKKRERGMVLLVESFLALGVVFATLALPLALDGRWTSAAWALEGAAVVWIGGRQDRRLAQCFGIALQFAAGISYLAAPHFATPLYPVANSDFLGSAFIALAGLFCAYRIFRMGRMLAEFARPVSILLLLWGTAWWAAGGVHEIELFVASADKTASVLIFFAASAAAFGILHSRVHWPASLIPQTLLFPAMLLMALVTVIGAAHPLQDLGWIGWPGAFAALLWILYRFEDELPHFVANCLHAGSLWLATGLACWEFAYWADRAVEGAGTWPFVAWAIVPGLVLACLSRFGERISWPLAKHFALYILYAAAPIAAYLYAWILFANVQSDGNPTPLAYLPLLNPLDVAMLLVLLALTYWFLRLRAAGLASNLPPRQAASTIGIAAFIWLNGALLRTLHHWAGIPYERSAMFDSMLAQTCVSVFWTVLACAMMLIATRRGRRTLWLTGGALLVIVVAKLFFIDLSHISGIERIVSFIGVGVLLLAIGYFSPVPPNRAEEKS